MNLITLMKMMKMNKIIQIPVSETILAQAKNLAQEMGEIRNSITKGDGNIAGFIGELVCEKLLSGAIRANTKDYDIRLASNNMTIDVKTKRTSVTPQIHYDCSVATLSLHQDCDSYAFFRVKNDYSVCWFLGLISHDQYFKIARKLKKGQIDLENNFTVKSDCFNVSIKDLLANDISHMFISKEYYAKEKE